MENQINLHDIKPLLEINDNSFYIYFFLLSLIIILLLISCFLLISFFKSKKVNLHKQYLKKLRHLDLDDTKYSAYCITKYGRLLTRNPREEKILQELIEDLHQYKYKKEVHTLSKNTKAKIEIFLDTINDR
jgi:hypothetical protein